MTLDLAPWTDVIGMSQEFAWMGLLVFLRCLSISVPALIFRNNPGRRLTEEVEGICDVAHGIVADRHYQLQQYGVKKRAHEDFDPVQAALVLEQVEADQQAQPLVRSAAMEPSHG